MPNKNASFYTYLFGIFSDVIDPNDLTQTLQRFAQQQELSLVFEPVTRQISLACLETIAVSLSKPELSEFVTLVQSQPNKKVIRDWLDKHLPDATLRMTEAAELAVFSLSDL